MRLKTITEDVANRVYDILIETCGQRDDYEGRMSFVAGISGEGQWTEYRFIGSLGFGGKVWNTGSRGFYVSCYPEDITPEREEMIEAANAKLAELYAEVDGA